MSLASNDDIDGETVSVASRVGAHYADLHLRAWKADDSHVQVIVHASPAGGMRHPVTVAFEARRMAAIRKDVEEDMAATGGDLGRMIDVGKGLAEVLLPEPVRTLLDRSLERVRPGDGIRLRLCLDDELIDLPWEFLYLAPVGSGESIAGFLALDNRIAIVREPPTALLRVAPSSTRQRLVFAGTMYTDATNPDLWDVKGEHERLVAALAPVADYLSVPFVTAAGDNIETALATRTAIFHYAGHTDVAEGQGYLIRDLQRGEVGGTLLSEALDGLLVRAGTRLASFSACNSGHWSFVGPLVRAGVPVVIGIQGNVFNVTATAFFEKLYASLAVGMSLDEAVSWARLSLLEPGVGLASDTSEWGAFMVYMPTTEAVLFPRPRTRAVRERQQAARRERQQTIYNVTQIIESNYGQVTGVADRGSR
ncbi:MAG TPA: CHAT domain-containing protein [Candidatus Limnocylindrales bacterium]